MTGFVKDMTAQLKEREAFLDGSFGKTFSGKPRKTLNATSSKPGWFGYGFVESGVFDLSEAQVAQFIKIIRRILPQSLPLNRNQLPRLRLKRFFRQRATDEQIQICTNFYFQFRELIVKEPDITSDSNRMSKFIEIHLVEPLMETYSSEIPSSEMIKVIKISSVAGCYGCRG